MLSNGKRRSDIPFSYVSHDELVKCNRRIMSLVSAFLNLYADIVDIGNVKDISASCGVSYEYAYAELLAASLGIDSGGRDRAFFKNYFVPMIRLLDVSRYLTNSYRRLITVPERKIGKWTLCNMELKPGEAFVCDDIIVTEDGRLIPQIGFFSESFFYPAILENGREWMTLMPNETVTTDPAVSRAFGKVATFGLGLGYFALEASQNDNVESVTVVELSSDAISLFKENILPQFPHSEKIRIVNEDAFEYAEKYLASEGFDFVFADIWHDVGDGKDMYLRMKEFEKLSPKTAFSYWLEDSIECYLDMSLWK